MQAGGSPILSTRFEDGMTTDSTGQPVLSVVRYLFAERVSTCRELRIFTVNKSVTADGSLLSPTGCVNGIHPAPDIHEHFMIHKGYGTLYIFTHNLNNLERTVNNCMNITMHTDANTAQF